MKQSYNIFFALFFVIAGSLITTNVRAMDENVIRKGYVSMSQLQREHELERIVTAQEHLRDLRQSILDPASLNPYETVITTRKKILQELLQGAKETR